MQGQSRQISGGDVIALSKAALAIEHTDDDADIPTREAEGEGTEGLRSDRARRWFAPNDWTRFEV
ncbi:hypothetical protein GV68_02730 [Pseudorhizobium pelagicum]|uniref:Uncharacterized protein n=2 Tax=Pseudorhizobium pelagicum TaxID=1509405 RepID=A0A922P0A9_9HYPH|nr:hypothetical protein GV68_02730 [Pseudorhizobium pelagicum]